MVGKGDKPRPVLDRKKYNSEYDRIFMEKICKNCKWWGLSRDGSESQGYKQCCNEDKIYYDINYFESIPEKDCLRYSDMESYNAALVTGEDFGCIHFKPLDKQS